MTDSILNTIKKLLGISNDDTSFDIDILVQINTAILGLIQIGVGPQSGYYVTSDSETWEEFIDDDVLLEGVKTYIYIKVRMVFDPPQNGAHKDALEKCLNEVEWRLQHVVEIMEGSNI